MADLVSAWLPALAPFLVFTVLLHVPGGLAGWLLGLRPSVALGFAPLVTTAVVGTSTTVCARLGVSFGLVPFAVCSAALIVAALGVRLATHRGRLDPERPRRTAWPAIAGALLVNLAAVGIAYARHIPGAQAPVYQYDTIWHLAVVRWFLDTGDYSSLDVGLLDGTTGGHFYPAAWHALVALSAQATGASVPAAMNGALLSLVLITWPLSIAWLTRVLFGSSRLLWTAAAALSFLPAVFPIGFLTYGVLYSNLFAYVLVPAAVVAITVALRAIGARRPARMPLPALVAVIVSIPIAFVFAQPNSAFTLLVIVLPLVVLTLDRLLRLAVRRWRRGWLRPAGHAVFAIAFVAAWIAIHDSSFLERTIAVNWAAGGTPTDAAGDWFSFADLTHPQWLLAVLVATGIVISLRRRATGWWLVSTALLCLLYMESAAGEGSGPDSLRSYLVGFWYTDARRLAAAAAILLVPYLAVAVSAIARRIAGAVRARTTRLSAPVVSIAVTGIVLCAIVADTVLDGAALRTRAAFTADSAQAGDAQWYSPREAAFIAGLGPLDGRVANNPYDGSAMAYSLGGLDVYFRALPGNWMGKPTPEQNAVRDRLKDAAADPSVCAAIEQEDIRYALVLDTGARPVFQNGPEQFPGLAITDDTPGFEPLAEDGDLRLYAITACG